MADTFSIKAAELPQVRRGTNKYKDILDQFVKSDLQTAVVGGYEAKPGSVAVGLRKLAEKDGLPVSVHNIQGQVYLRKVEVAKGK